MRRHTGEGMQRRTAASTASGAEEFQAVLADAMRSTGASLGLLYLMLPGERVLRLAAAGGVSRRITAPWLQISMDDPIPVVDAIRQQRLVWLAGQEEIARRYPRLGIVLSYDIMLAAAPFTSGARASGGLVLLWPVQHPPKLSADEQDAIGACCHRAAQLVRQAADSGRPLLPADQPWLLPPTRTRAPDPIRAAAALDYAERVPTGCCALDMDGRVTYINPAAGDLLGVGTEALLGTRPWEVLTWLRNPLFEDRYRAAVISRRPTSFTALCPPDQWLSFELHPDDRGISVHIAPAATRPAPAEDTGQPSATTEEQIGATALYHLTHLAATLTEAVGVGDVVERVADQIVPAFGPTAMALMAVQGGRLHILGHRGYPEELMVRFDGEPLTSRTPAAHVLNTGIPSFFATFTDLERAYPAAVHEDGMASWAFLPLITSGRTVGSLVLAYDRPRPFPTPERAILTSLAGLIAQALDRARLYDAEHTLARTLQTALLPPSLPRIPGLEAVARYLPADRRTDIGGDFYDLIHCHPASAAATIGDVQGHNIQAAALMGQVRTAVYAHATTAAPPADVLAKTNRLLTNLEPGLFASCLYVQLDLARHRARLATAGHPPPLVRHPDGRSEVLDLPTGLLLGIEPDVDYPDVELPLPPGTLLALYTDGLVETPGTDIDDATSTLAEQLAHGGRQDLDDLADALLHHAEVSAPRHDDIALLLIRATA
ncbi:SpoIIE family protein phosphatase [Streptomyces sp. NPDC001920]